MKNILTIIKKELDRVFRDKRLILTVMILPGLMLFGVYTFIGNAVQRISETAEVAIVNNQADFKTIYETAEAGNDLEVINITPSQVAEYKQKVDDKDWSLVIVFDPDFADYQGVGAKPGVTIYFNPNVLGSSSVASRFQGYLNYYQTDLSHELYGSDKYYFDFTADQTPTSENVQAGLMVSSLLPMLVMMFLFAGAMSVGPESIAGEKERGTIATLLVTPVKRSEIALGKVISLSFLALISALSSFLGISLSLPKLLNLNDVPIGSIYQLSDYLMILAALFATVFVIVGIISIISAYAKTLKEANSMILPIYILTLIVSITTMFSSGSNTNIFMYLIPIYNTVQTLVAIMQFEPQAPIYLLVTVIANIVYVTIFIYILNRMFNSEKYMFSK